jgi:hypothetical protein
MSFIESAWELRPEIKTGDHAFAGPILLSKQVVEKLVMDEVAFIVHHLRSWISEHEMVGRVQIYDNRYTGDSLYWVNRLSRSAMRSGLFYADELLLHNHSFMMLSEEFRKYKRAKCRFRYFEHGEWPMPR